VITQDDEVLILEDIMGDVDGSPTFTLLRAAEHLKDNRLLPKGWNPNHPDAEHTGVHGGASQDESFMDGEDTVSYEFVAPTVDGPYRIQADFLYQTLSPRFAAELFSPLGNHGCRRLHRRLVSADQPCVPDMLLRCGRERKPHAVVAIMVLPAVIHVRMIVVVAQHVFIDPVASHVVAVLVEVHPVTVDVDDSAADVKRVLRVVPQRLMRGEGPYVVLLRPCPISRNRLSIEPTGIQSAELLHPVLDRMLKLQPDSSVRVYVGAVTAR
jgi:hypothetical protein